MGMGTGAPRGAWTRYRTAAGSDIARLAVKVWICNGCFRFHRQNKPAQCPCGRMDFEHFDSDAEAKRWAGLLMLQRAKRIANLRRQVRYPLFTVDEATGKPVQFGAYVADFVYDDLDLKRVVIEDKKGSAISPEAKLKLRVMEASGRTVTLT